MTIARSEVVEEGAEMTYHCISRCVRRAFLCGSDSYTGKSYEHRKGWVKERLEELSGIFAIDICGYAVMSNHLHLVLRTRPDLEKQLSDREVSERWQKLFFRKQKSSIAKASNSENMLIQNNDHDQARINLERSRLGSISWFMRCVNEYIARKANREDDCKGRFWEGRFKCQALLDEAAELACLAYVDLNPVRTRQVESPEKSKYTSVSDRIVAYQARDRIRKLRKRNKGHSITPKQKNILKKEFSKRNIDKWLNPLGSSNKKSRKGILSLNLQEYLELLDWTGRAIVSGKPGSIPEELLPVLKRLEIDSERWVNTVLSFGKLFFQVAGKLQNIAAAAKRAGRKWLKGIKASAEAFPQAAT